MNQLMKEVYLQRLKEYADYMAIIETPDENSLSYDRFVYVHLRQTYTYGIQYHYWALQYMSDIFSEFYYNDLDELCYNLNGRSIDHVAGVFVHFGINAEEFCMIFETNGRPFAEKYGATALHKTSTAKDIAQNIRKVVEFKNTEK